MDLVFDELNLRLRSEGEARAEIERSVLVERAVAKCIQRHNIEVAITWLVMAKQLVEKDNMLRFAHRGATVRQLPSATRGIHRHRDSKPHKARAYPLVKDVIARRVDGRPQHAEPLDAFAEELEKLGYRQFRMWWMQTVSELRQSNPSSTPVAVAVLAAALVEGALTFIVKHARANGQFQSRDYERGNRAPGRSMTWSRALRQADPRPFSIYRARRVQKRSSVRVSASMPAACYQIIRQAPPTCALTRRATPRAERTRSCVRSSTGCRRTRLKVVKAAA